MMMAVSRSARQPRKWTIAEDQKLREEVETQRNEGEVKDWYVGFYHDYRFSCMGLLEPN
jgi:hypothetical protein